MSYRYEPQQPLNPPDPEGQEYYRCPCCDAVIYCTDDLFVVKASGEVVGCEKCVKRQEAWEKLED